MSNYLFSARHLWDGAWFTAMFWAGYWFRGWWQYRHLRRALRSEK